VFGSQPPTYSSSELISDPRQEKNAKSPINMRLAACSGAFRAAAYETAKGVSARRLIERQKAFRKKLKHYDGVLQSFGERTGLEKPLGISALAAAFKIVDKRI
jgi:hypothetical protein